MGDGGEGWCALLEKLWTRDENMHFSGLCECVCIHSLVSVFNVAVHPATCVRGFFQVVWRECVCVSVCLRVGWGLGLCCLPKCMATHKCVSATMCHFKHMLPRSSPFGGSLICGTQPDSLWSDPGGQHSVVPRATWCSLGGKKLEICLCPYYHCLFCSLSTLTGEYNRCTYIHINVTIQMHTNLCKHVCTYKTCIHFYMLIQLFNNWCATNDCLHYWWI